MTAPLTRVNDVHARLVEIAQLVAFELRSGRFTAAVSQLRPFLRPETVRDLAARELAMLASQEPFATKSPVLGELRILSGTAVDLRVRIVQPDADPGTRLKTLSRHTVVGNSGRTPFTVERWYQPEPEPNDLFDARKILERGRDIVVEPGDAVACRAAHEAFTIVAGERPAIAMLAGGAHVVPLKWVHRRDSGRPLSAEPATRDWLLLRELLAFSEALSDPALVPAIGLLGEHPSHFIRWNAAKTSIKLSPSTATTTLRALANDPHTQVRAAATHLLSAMKR